MSLCQQAGITKQSCALLSYPGKSCISACLKTILWVLVRSTYDSSRQCSGRNCWCPNWGLLPICCRDEDFWQLSWGAFKNLCQKNRDGKEIMFLLESVRDQLLADQELDWCSFGQQILSFSGEKGSFWRKNSKENLTNFAKVLEKNSKFCKYFICQKNWKKNP